MAALTIDDAKQAIQDATNPLVDKVDTLLDRVDKMIPILNTFEAKEIPVRQATQLATPSGNWNTL